MAHIDYPDLDSLLDDLTEKELSKMSVFEKWAHMRNRLYSQELPDKEIELLQGILNILHRIYMELIKTK